MTKSQKLSNGIVDKGSDDAVLLAAKNLCKPAKEQNEIPVRIGLARELRSRGKLKEAEDLYSSVLEFQPNHMTAAISLVQLAATRNEHSLVVERAAKARRIAPDNPVIAQLEGKALVSLGDKEKALEVLSKAVAQNPKNLELQLVLAQALRSSGRLEEARTKFAELRGKYPNRNVVWVRSIDFLFEEREIYRALEVCDEAPIQSIEIDLRRAKALRTLGQREKAYTLLSNRRALETSHNAHVLCEMGITLHSMGALNEAEKKFAEAISENPEMIAAHVGRINVLFAKNDMSTAETLIAEARSRRPENPALKCLEADALIRKKDFSAARDYLNRMRDTGVETPQVQMMISRALIGLGDSEGAEALSNQILKQNPTHQPAAISLIDALMLNENVPRARLVLENIVSAIHNDLEREKRTWINPEIHIRRAELAMRLEDLATARVAMRDLERVLDSLGPGQILRCAKMALRLGFANLAAKNLATFLKLSNTPHTAAAEFTALLRGLGQEGHARKLSSSVVAQVREGDQESARLAITTQLDGPIAAMKMLRNGAVIGDRTYPAALQVSKTLIAAGERDLANRYLRFCVRRWPLVPGLVDCYVSNCLRIGLFQDVLAFLDALGSENGKKMRQRHRVEALVALGDMDAAFEIATSSGDLAMGALLDGMALQISLAQGNLKKAEELVRKRLSLPSTTRRNKAHFSASHFGNLLNELRLISMSSTGMAGGRPATETIAYFQPAKRILDQWLDTAVPHFEHGEPIPRRITQYWDASTPPDPVSSVMATWRHVSGFEYTRFDHGSAEKTLREKLGIEYSRAFRLANTKTEAADFARLCMLWLFGGIYVDADDRLVGDPHKLLEDVKGCLLYREPYGAISNNLMCAAPQHPVIGQAMEMAKASLLGRENDGTWSKTGPGMITRAVASIIQSDSSALENAGLTIRKQHQCHPYVSTHILLPHKTSPGYWNWHGENECPRAILDVLNYAVET